MGNIVFLDTNDLIYAIKAGLGDWQEGQPVSSDAYRFLDDLLASDNRLVTNTIIVDELTAGGYPDGEMVSDWIRANSSRIEVDNIPPEIEINYTGSDRGERSLALETAKNPIYQPQSGRQIFLSGEDFSNRQWFNDAGYGADNYRNRLGLYAEDFAVNPSENTYLRGADYVESMRFKYPGSENLIFGKPLGPIKGLADFWRSISFDERGAVTIPEMGSLKWSDLPESVQGKIFHLAGEGVGAALIGLDSAQTYEEVIDALSRGDLKHADELIGGLLGRAFGGAFLGAIAGIEVGSPFGPVGIIVAGIVGSIVGAFGGGLIGEWLFGKAADFGFDAVDALDALGDLLRHFRSDPLVLDLDGNGITLTALNASNTRFDVDGDGAIERVGWIDPNDGLLVLDANQNGQVDGIDELIGNTHVDGFDELALLDSNGDGKINQQDAEFSKLLVWRDVNGDGVSSPSELLTTAQAGITSFNLAYTSSGANAGGNVIARVGSYTLASGAQRAMGSVQFAKDETVTRPTLPQGADLSEIGTLPNLGGYGPIADLRTSMFHDPTLKGMVLNLVAQNHDFDTFKDFLDGGFMDILYRWAGIDLHAPGETSASLKEKLIEALTGESLFDLSASQQARIDDVFDSIIGRFGVGFLIQAADRSRNMLMVDLGSQLAGLDPSNAGYLDTVADLTDSVLSNIANLELPYEYLEKFSDLSLDPETGLVTGDFDAFAREFIKDQPSFGSFVAASSGPPPAPPKTNGYIVSTFGSGEEVPEPEPVHPWQAWYEKEGSLLFNVAAAMGISGDYVKNVTGWQWLMKPAADVHGTSGNDVLNVVVSTITEFIASTGANGGTVYTQQSRQTRDQRLYGYEGNDELRGNDGVDTLIGGAGNDLLFGGSDSDMYVYSAGSGLDRITEESGAEDAIFFSSELKLEDLRVIRITGTNDLQLHFGDSSQGIILTNQVNMGNSAVERFSFVGVGPLSAGDIATIYLRTLNSEAGDSITGTRASESIYGLGGNDTLSGWDGDDIIDGGDGDDILKGENGNDTIIGGKGNDTIDAGAGNDVIIGGQGDEIIAEGGSNGDDTYVWNLGDGDDVITGGDWNDGFNSIRFGPGITAADLRYAYANGGAGLKISVAGQPGSITISNQLSYDTRALIDQLLLADGTVLNRATFEAAALTQLATSGNDTLWGSWLNQSIDGGDGDDVIDARGGNDVIIGGLGNDRFAEGGSNGDDTYVWNLGDGDDVITGGDWNDGFNTIQFGAGITAADLRYAYVNGGAGLKISIAGQPGSVTISNQLSYDINSLVDRLTFVDSTVLDRAAFEAAANSQLATVGNDMLWGSGLSQTINGGDGDDIIDARGGNDVIVGGHGNDTFAEGGSNGDDTYIWNLGDGDDVITGGDWNDGFNTIQFGAGITAADLRYAYANGGAGLKISVVGQPGSVTINNQLTYGNGALIDRLLFADGTVLDRAAFETAANSQLATAGNDMLWGSGLNQTIDGGDGDDIIDARAGNDVIIGGKGNDRFAEGGSNGDDTYVWNLGDGDDVITGGDWNDGFNTIQFGAGITAADLRYAYTNGGAGLKISVAGQPGSITISNQLSYGAGALIDRLLFADGTVLARAAFEEAAVASMLVGTPGNDTLLGNGLNQTIDGDDGDDIIDARAGNDILIGGQGNDVLTGGDGNDILNGGAGDDLLYGNAGDDTFVFNMGDGQDIISNDGTSGDVDTVQLGAGILTSDVTVIKSDSAKDLVLLFAGSTDRITLNDTITDVNRRIERVTFADGTVWTHADLLARATLTPTQISGTTGDDILTGGASDDLIYGSGGHDVLDGNSGNDFIDAGDGNDTVRGGTGTNVIVETNGNDTYLWSQGDGNDRLQGGGAWDGINTLQLGAGISRSDLTFSRVAGTTDIRMSVAGESGSFTFADGLNVYGDAQVDTIRFADGSTMSHAEYASAAAASQGTASADNIYGSRFNDVINGGAGNDVIDANIGDDTIRGGAGDNVIVETSGNDTYLWDRGDGNDRLQGGGNWDGINTLQLGADISRSDLTFSRVAGTTDIKMSVAGESGSFTFADGLNVYGDAQVDTIRFADGSTMTHAEYAMAAVTSQSTGGVDNIYGSRFNDVIEGGAGNDVIDANEGNDTIRGGAGDNVIVETGGNDTYLWNRGDGNDRLQGGGNWDGINTLQLGAGISRSDLTFSRVMGTTDIRMSVAGESGSFTFADGLNIYGDAQVDTIRFADGSTMSHAEYAMATVTSQATAGIDNIYGSRFNDVIEGGAGNDVIDANEGNDTIRGGAGDNVIVETGGNDTYLWDRGDGNDRLQGGGNWDGINTLQLGVGISQSDLTFSRVMGTTDIKMSVAGESGSFTFADGLNVYGDAQVDTIRFADGSTMTHAEYAMAAVTSQSTGGVDNIYGSRFNDVIEGGAGNDVIDAQEGNDTIRGGAGDNVIVETGGNDTYLWNRGDGNDRLQGGGNWDGINTLQLGVGISRSDLTFSRVTGTTDIKMTVAGESGSFTFADGLNVYGDAQVDTIRFADGTTMSHAEYASAAAASQATAEIDRIYGSRFNDVINGGAGDDEIDANLGDDTVRGGTGNDLIWETSGNDTYLWERGDGVMTIRNYGSWDGYNTLSFGAGISQSDIVIWFEGTNVNIGIEGESGSVVLFDQRTTGEGVDRILFADGSSWDRTTFRARAIAATMQADTLSGTAGADSIRGLGGDDNLSGLAGNDVLRGEAGNDLLNGGADVDTALLRGNQADYTIATTNGVLTVTDNQKTVDGDDGTDTLIGVESAGFKDGSINLASPILLDLNGDGVSLVDNKRTKVGFDWDGDGARNQTGWVGKDDGFLFIDRDNNGTVTNAGELSFTSDKEGAKSDLDGLRAFDSNGDGIFSSADDQFSQFKVWRDKNGNGRVDKKEILSLQAAGVASIDLTGEAVNKSWEWGDNITVNTGSFTRTNGTVGSFSDVALSYDTASSQNAAINKAASQLSEAMAGFWNGRGIAALSKFEALAERRDSLLAVVHGEWR